MDFEPYDSSGTDDDLPPPHQNRIPRGGRVVANGRPSVGYSRMYGEMDMETQIKRLEQEAYSSVLRAFKAQADAITWEKESLITELRKELRLSNEEHRELLSRVNSDDIIGRIREWRQGGGGQQPGMVSTAQVVHDPIPSPTVSVSRKKSKISQSVPSQSFVGPSTSFHPPAVSGSYQPSSSAVKRGSHPGVKGKKQKPSFSSGPAGRSQVANRVSSAALAGESAEGVSLIGKKVRTRWPDDNHFYEAVITDYNSVEGRHALVYDINTPNETWEWVNLSEISREDIQWVGEDPGISLQRAYGGAGHGINRAAGRDHVPSAGRGRASSKVQSRKELLPSQNGIGKKASNDIRLLDTNTVTREVKRVYTSSLRDPLEMDKAKKVLQDHENSLIDALSRLADISDGESDEGGHEMSRAHSIDGG